MKLKRASRWQNKPYTYLLNDYDRLLQYLFSEFNETTSQYYEASMNSLERVEPPPTMLDRIRRVWERLLPHRELIIGGGKVEVQPRGGGDPYNASELSDGERVVFYLVGQCLAPAPGAILVVDEPEIHLHKAIQYKLWDAIEESRPDCQFVYLTHDLEFAASRSSAWRLWLESFEEGRWSWHEAPSDSGLPESVLLTVLGSRKPVLFVEGTQGSLDTALYRTVYSDHTIVPRESCDAVIHSTRSFRALQGLHHLACSGLIDRDRRTDEEVAGLEARGVNVLPVSEIEHVMLMVPVLEKIEELLAIEQADSRIPQIRDMVFSKLRDAKKAVAAKRAAHRIDAQLKRFDLDANGEPELVASLAGATQSIDVGSIFREELGRIETALTALDYEQALALYDDKGLFPSICPLYQQSPRGLQSQVLRWLGAPMGTGLLSAMMRALPSISSS